MRLTITKPRDAAEAAVPFYFAAIGAEYLWLRSRRDRPQYSAGQYERRDNLTSLTMGTISLLAPLVVPKVLAPLRLGRGRRLAQIVAASALVAGAVTAVADRSVRQHKADDTPLDVRDEVQPPFPATPLDQVRRLGGTYAVAAGGLVTIATVTSATTPQRLFTKRVIPDLGSGAGAVALAILGWDFLYYWNHRFSHEVRYLWASHVVHHSSEHYNLGTALRQPVTDSLGSAVPYGLLSVFGLRPGLVQMARGINLVYQFWVHTEAIDRLGAPEMVLNSPSHHRVHHGSNRQYLDRNHGGILIAWDRLFGTFEAEDEPVVYGLTKNIRTFRPEQVISHEFTAMMRDVAGATSWPERLSYVVRSPGWSPVRAALPSPSAVTSAA